MANKIKEIKKFFSGIISSFSSSDIKDDNASFSLNVDSSEKDGVLKGSKKESDLINAIEIDTNVSKVLESEQNRYDLVYADAESGDVKIISDLYGGRTIKTPIGASGVAGTAESMEVKNDKVYVGHGKSVPPKILFRTKKTPFKEESDTLSEWIYEKSSLYDKRILNSSFSVDRFINFPGAGIKNATHTSYTSAIGIRYDHKDLYYIDYDGLWDANNDVFDLSAAQTKVHLGNAQVGRDALAGAACDICQADVKEYADSVSQAGNDLVATKDFKVWVLTINHLQSESTTGVPQLQRFKIRQTPGRDRGGSSNTEDKGNHTKYSTHMFEFKDNNGPPEGAIPGSVLETSNYLWIQYWKPSGDKFTRKENFLYCASLTHDVPSENSNAPIVFTNKSLNYDRIKKKLAKIHFGNKYLTHRYNENYWYNSDRSWTTTKKGNWLRGSEAWNARTKEKGNHYYSGIYSVEGEPGFTPVRHGLIQSPLTDKEDPNINTDESEDWVAVMTTCDEQYINIYSAWEYRVAGGWNWHSYYRLRAADDNGYSGGSANEGGAGNWIIEALTVIFNVIDFLLEIVGGLFISIIDRLGVWPGAGVEHFTRLFYGAEDLNWYYNGKCFETGMMSTQLINISSNHDPTAKLNYSDGARVRIRELYGFNKNLEIVCVKHYHDRLMISCHDPSKDDRFVNTLFLMYNTSDNAITEQEKIQIMVLDPDDENLDQEWRDHAEIPDAYLQEGSSADEGNSHPNKILQMYVPVTDLSMHNYSEYPELLAGIDDQVEAFYPHLHSYFFNITNEVAVETSHLWNKNLTGDVFYTEDAVFDIYRTGLNVFDGQKTRMNASTEANGIGYSGQETVTGNQAWKTEGDHISFMSTAGPFNVSKFNFLIVEGENVNPNSTVNSNQLNLPGNNGKIFPDDAVAILSLNQSPNASDDTNIKQYALDSKSISFSVKSHPYDGLNMPAFIYNEDDGKELYRYKINLVYDGYQDSPLCTHYTQVNITDANVRHNNKGTWASSTAYKKYDYVLRSGEYYTCLVDHTSTDDTNVDTGRPETSNSNAWNQEDANVASALNITINLHKPEIMSRRITDIRLWRSRLELNESNVTGDDVYTVEQAYTLVTTIPLESNWNVSNEASTLYNSSESDTTLGEVATFTCTDNGTEDVSFEAYTGMSEEVKVYQPNYTLSTQILSYLFVANCQHPSFEDATNLIFRSQPDRYNTFDWTRDFVSIPSTPKAITSFNGRIVVWDFNNMYVINPGNLYIEDTFEGTGCLSSTSFERTENGICFADDNNIYMYDGKRVKNIGIPVASSHKQGLKVSWKDRDREYHTHIKFEADKRCFCIFFRISGDIDYNWLLRAIKAQHYEDYQILDNPPLRWYDIPGAENNGDNTIPNNPIAQNPNLSPRYVWHLGMWQNHFENVEIYSKADYDYEFGNKTITLPFGTGYDLHKGHYIVDLISFTKGENIAGILDTYNEDEIQGNALYVLQKDDYPNYANIITNGKFDMEHLPSYYFYSYNIDKNRWDLHQTSKYKGVFNGPKGELYSSMITRDEAVLDVNAITGNVQKFYTYGNTPFTGTLGLLEHLDNTYGLQLHANLNPKIITELIFKKLGSDENMYGEVRWEMGLNGNIVSAFSGYTEGQFYVDIVCAEPHKMPTDIYGAGVGKTIDLLGNFNTPASFTVGALPDENTIRIWFGSTNPLNYYDNIYGTGYGQGTWKIDDIKDTTRPVEGADFTSGEEDAFGGVVNGRYIEVVCSEPHNRVAGQTVVIREDNTPGTLPFNWSGNGIHSNLSPYHVGKEEVITYVVDEYRFRFNVRQYDEYFESDAWLHQPDADSLLHPDDFVNTHGSPTNAHLYLAGDYHYLLYNNLQGATWPTVSQFDLSVNWFHPDIFGGISVGDLNQDGGINILDTLVLQDSKYIILKGKEFEDKSYFVDGIKYYPDIVLVDTTADNNYHKLTVLWCYPVRIGTAEIEWVSYLLIKNQTYPFEDTDYGWNHTSMYSSSNPIPDNSLIVLNTEAIVLPGEPGLKQLFGSSDTQQFTFISKNFSFENQTTNKILSKVKIVYQNTKPSFQYMINNNKQWIVPNGADIIYEEDFMEYKIPLEHKKVKSFKIKIISNSKESNPHNYDTEVDSFSIIYRERGNA